MFESQKLSKTQRKPILLIFETQGNKGFSLLKTELILSNSHFRFFL